MTRSSKKRIGGKERIKYRIRKKVSGTDERPRISVGRSDKHTYAQVISDVSGRTLLSASTLEKEVVDAMASVSSDGIASDSKSSKSVLAAKAVGFVLGKRCKEKNIERAVFDRNGMVYHGRVKAIAEGAREAGLSV